MGHEDYWLAISRDGTLLGGGFFVTRFYALTTAACVRGLAPGDAVDLHTATGLPLEGQVFEVADDIGLALLGVRPDPLADYATPQADHAVKGDAWRAPYRPSPVAAALMGTVDAVAHDRRDGDGRPVSLVELTPERGANDYGGYAGGPVERRTEGRDVAVVGILLTPEDACRLRDGAENILTAGAINSAVEAFHALSAEQLMGLLAGVEEVPSAALPPTEVPGTTPQSPPCPAAPGRAEAVREALDTGRLLLRAFKQMAEESLVDPRDLSPYQIRVLEEISQRAWGEEAP
ncbi:serine protease [Streptomyces griseosporeus]|uniref:serine protease n=1 Tax=Streptomyces griseosporeus TaxID=1910 RepID=UPI00167CA01D|nr:serine protease [Streptomyces griseosporeus]